jgi:hypothetical protein
VIQFARCSSLHDPDDAVHVHRDGTDTKDVHPTWIFQRGGEHLLLHYRETARGVTLLVSGDGELRSYTFHDFAALEKFESEMAEFLMQAGWTPAHLTIEPQQPQPASDHILPSDAGRRPGAAH